MALSANSRTSAASMEPAATRSLAGFTNQRCASRFHVPWRRLIGFLAPHEAAPLPAAAHELRPATVCRQPGGHLGKRLRRKAMQRVEEAGAEERPVRVPVGTVTLDGDYA